MTAQVPCLLSVPASLARRRTRLTVEAISLDAPDADSPSWVGINQAATNLCAPLVVLDAGGSVLIRSLCML